MTETTALTVQPRTIIGKANRRLAAEGQIPAVLYGAGRESVALSVDRHAFEVLMSHQGGGSTLVELSVEGESSAVNTIIKELQKSPVKGTVLHIDFLAIRMDEVIEASVALSLIGDSEGVKGGGILMQNATTVLVSVLPADLPDSIAIDISELELGDNLHISDIVAPAGVEIIDDPQALLCSVTTPTEEPEEEEVELEEGEEPELIGEEGEEGEEGEGAPAGETEESAE